MPMYESEFFLDWNDGKREMESVSSESIENKKRRKEREKTAKYRSKETPLSFAEKSANTQIHRQEEINRSANPVDSQTENNIKVTDVNQAKNKVIYLPRRSTNNKSK